jgi:hypothetical protein
MRQEIVPTVSGGGPPGIVEHGLSPKVLGDSQAFSRTKVGNTVTPIVILGHANRPPVAGHEGTNPSRDHRGIVMLLAGGGRTHVTSRSPAKLITPEFI